LIIIPKDPKDVNTLLRKNPLVFRLAHNREKGLFRHASQKSFVRLEKERNEGDSGRICRNSSGAEEERRKFAGR
jgi:hypothetical protein